MTKLLVDTPDGAQEWIEVGPGGGYFDAARVVWDERVDGPLPELEIGGLVRDGATLRVSADRWATSMAARLAKAKETQRAAIRAAYEAAAVRPVAALGVEWNGGYDSATRLLNARILASELGATTVTFYDSTNVARALMLADAQSVVLAVAGACSQAFDRKQALLVAIDTATSSEELEAIQWAAG